ncbi:class I SAM-dependent methyltransferase [Paracoccus sp. WLY502]|uniref:class I SAM-dependent methyltransferase n=1 Tax=Paracoccus yibinensis TaxID=3068891 RepID=UPI00279695F1|nr:class I SAM-dependent methyltransferase [Paracoccus sp. WLY502]MDQ1902413.1 class I SAM-dependent methyltransferase [Paracoccus sp. WLY502]
MRFSPGRPNSSFISAISLDPGKQGSRLEALTARLRLPGPAAGHPQGRNSLAGRTPSLFAKVVADTGAGEIELDPPRPAFLRDLDEACSGVDFTRGADRHVDRDPAHRSFDLLEIHVRLDVAAGNGNVSLALARRGAAVVSTDYVPALLERGQRRAEAEGLPLAFQVADAEALPFADGSFDAVASTFGVMFAPTRTALRPRCCASVAPAAGSGWPTGPPTASWARCSERWGAIFLRLPV